LSTPSYLPAGSAPPATGTTTTTIDTTLNNAGTITIKAGTTLVAPYLVNIP
jgi:hypothetical protein